MPSVFCRLRGLVFAAACVGWSLTLGACHHPLAQRPSGAWSTPRVLVDDPQHDNARVRPVTKAGFYALTREWDQNGRVAADAPRPDELAQAYLDVGQLLGFRRAGPDRVVAVFGTQEIEIQLTPGIHHVWYRERTQWTDPGATTFLLGALGVAALVGLIVVLANSDDSSVNINVN